MYCAQSLRFRFQGVIITDWEDIKTVYTIVTLFAATPEKARFAMAINAGIDMSMVPTDFSFYDLLLEAVKNELMFPYAAVFDDAVKRILLLKMKKLACLINPYPGKLQLNTVNFR